MRIKPIRIIAAAAALMMLSGCYFFPAEEDLLEPPTVAIEEIAYSTYTAKVKDIASRTVASGYVIAKNDFNCGFTESGGTLKKIHVNVGDYVEKGDLIAELDTGNLEYLYEQQKLIVEKARITYLNSGSSTDKLDYEMEQNTLTEYERLMSVSHLYAGMSGQICFIQNLRPGDTVTAYKTIIKIIDPQSLCVQYTSNTLRAFPLGADVTITVGGTDYAGYVSKTPNDMLDGIYDGNEEISADTSSIYCEFKDELPGFLTVGQLADISAVYEVHENAVVISKNLIKNDGDRTYVTILDETDTKKEVDVTVGITNATEAEITSGLKAGDRVVVR
ncbi:MAG: efflux RND transporter periplasmic adaptor subunit [Oscillospiraceae bacterium]